MASVIDILYSIVISEFQLGYVMELVQGETSQLQSESKDSIVDKRQKTEGAAQRSVLSRWRALSPVPGDQIWPSAPGSKYYGNIQTRPEKRQTKARQNSIIKFKPSGEVYFDFTTQLELVDCAICSSIARCSTNVSHQLTVLNLMNGAHFNTSS
jgi:hypothetical protein